MKQHDTKDASSWALCSNVHVLSFETDVSICGRTDSDREKEDGERKIELCRYRSPS